MLWNGATLLAICGMLALSACASKYAQRPARLDLQPYGHVALVAFTSENERGGLSALATQRFAEAVLESQTGFELVELGGSDPALKDLPARTDPVVLAQALGEKKNLPAVFVGHLKVSGVKPRARISAGDMNLRAAVSAELTVRLLSTRTGGTLWRSSSVADGTVGKVGLAGGLPSIAVRDAETAYGKMLHAMVADVTRDLRPTWVKQ
ncbi:MAG: hypothetical protein H0T68_10015 [Gemmatimonadales bacterium]|nr:hypothetical protein [Gemmatimonadales bacterium]